MCVFAAALHLCWSGCGFRVRPSAPSCLASLFSTFSYASLLCVLPMFVSHRSVLVAVYDEAGFLGGFTCGGVWVGILMLHPTGVPYVCVWGFFCDGGVVYPLLLLGVSGRLLLSLFWCACSAISLGHLRFSAVCHAAGDPSGAPRLADSGWLTSSCGGGFPWGWEFLATAILLPHFGFLPCASAAPLPLLPLRGSAPLPGASACLTPVCWSTPVVVLEGSVLCHLVFLPCAVLFLRACSVRCFP